MRKLDSLFPEPLRLPRTSPRRSSETQSALKLLINAPRGPVSRAFSWTCGPRLALAGPPLGTRPGSRPSPGLGRSSGRDLAAPAGLSVGEAGAGYRRLECKPRAAPPTRASRGGAPPPAPGWTPAVELEASALPECAFRLHPTGLVCRFRFPSPTLRGHPSPSHAPHRPLGGTKGCALGCAGPTERLCWGHEARGRGRARVPGPGAGPPSQALRPSPSVRPKLPKLQKCPGACPPRQTTPNRTRRKESEYGAAESAPRLLGRLPSRPFPSSTGFCSPAALPSFAFLPALSIPLPLFLSS